MSQGMKADVVIVGAGVVGSALAMALGELGHSDVLVVDVDLEGTLSSSELNAGGVRATFHQDANVLCSKLSIDWFAANAEAIGYRAVGYLWMHRPEGMDRVCGRRGGGESDLERWNRLGWPVEAWDVARLRAHAPFIDRTDDLAGAVFGKRDGILNSNLLKGFYRERAKARGVRFADRLALRGATVSAGGVSLELEQLASGLDRDGKEKVYASLESEGAGGARVRAEAARVVNCAGPWAREVARTLGYASPSWNVRRQISMFDCREVDLSPYGMMIDPSGVYFHPEAGYILGGIAEREEPRGQNFGYGGEEFFQEKIWVPLSERSTKFEALRHLNGWGGLYEVSPDESAIIGEVRASGIARDRVFESHSYSGHGVMHSYACGVALAERLVRGNPSTVDLEPFNGDRFEKGLLIPETAVI
jgi:sarcosine oxidase subunit beta